MSSMLRRDISGKATFTLRQLRAALRRPDSGVDGIATSVGKPLQRLVGERGEKDGKEPLVKSSAPSAPDQHHRNVRPAPQDITQLLVPVNKGLPKIQPDSYPSYNILFVFYIPSISTKEELVAIFAKLSGYRKQRFFNDPNQKYACKCHVWFKTVGHAKHALGELTAQGFGVRFVKVRDAAASSVQDSAGPEQEPSRLSQGQNPPEQGSPPPSSQGQKPTSQSSPPSSSQGQKPPSQGSRPPSSQGKKPPSQAPPPPPPQGQSHPLQGPPPPPNDTSSIPTKMLEAAATALASILVLGTGFALGGYLYHKFYKHLVLIKMEEAFAPGDPVLELAAQSKGLHASFSSSSEGEEEHWIRRSEQDKIDSIVNGTATGHYYLLIGEKGTGKSSMLLDAMRKISGEGVSMLEAHADLEIFRIRLGKALNFEFHEDYIGSYFSERGPRDSTALLDIERAFNKLEKVALRRRDRMRHEKGGARPLILIVNSMHLLRDDEDGRDLLELLQQRAEQWAAANLVTVVFNSDDYWVYERLKQLATRMEVLPVGDLPKDQAMSALSKYRKRYFGETPEHGVLEEVYRRVGGRLTFLNKVAKSESMLGKCDEIYETEKTWFLNQCWVLGQEMDDDVMDQQKYASAAMVLACALVDAENLESNPSNSSSSSPTSASPPSQPSNSTFSPPDLHAPDPHALPSIPLHLARQIMTRADFIRSYDHSNLFTITPYAQVRADSVPMQRAFRDIVNTEGFREHLDETIRRIGDIESLGRTREVVLKDLVNGGRYRVKVGEGKRGEKGDGKGGVEVELVGESGERGTGWEIGEGGWGRK